MEAHRQLARAMNLLKDKADRSNAAFFASCKIRHISVIRGQKLRQPQPRQLGAQSLTTDDTDFTDSSNAVFSASCLVRIVIGFALKRGVAALGSAQKINRTVISLVPPVSSWPFLYSLKIRFNCFHFVTGRLAPKPFPTR